MFERAKKKKLTQLRRNGSGSPAAAEAPPERPTVSNSRTTSYRQDMEGPPPSEGTVRTTSYPNPSQRSWRGFDSIN